MGFNDINIQVSGPQQPASIYKTKVLKGQVPFSTQVTEANTKYVIKHNFDLGGESVTIPEGCVLEFDGGSISGEQTITGNNTGIEAGLVKIFSTNVTLAGTWNVTEAYPEWFGAKGDAINDDSIFIQKALDVSHVINIHKVVLVSTKYRIDSTIYIPYKTCLEGNIGLYPNGFELPSSIYFYGEGSAFAINIDEFSNNAPNDITIKYINIFNVNEEHVLEGCGIAHYDYYNNDYTNKRFSRNLFKCVGIYGFKYGLCAKLSNGNGFSDNIFEKCVFKNNIIGIFVDCEGNDSWITANKFDKCRISSNKAWGVYAENNNTSGTHNIFAECLIEGNGGDYNYSLYELYGCGCIYNFNQIVRDSYIERNYPNRIKTEEEIIDTDKEMILSGNEVVPVDILSNPKCACFVGTSIIEANYLNNVFIIVNSRNIIMSNNTIRKNTVLEDLKGFVMYYNNPVNAKWDNVSIKENIPNTYGYERVFQYFSLSGENINTRAVNLINEKVFNINVNSKYEHFINCHNYDINQFRDCYINPSSEYTGAYIPIKKFPNKYILSGLITSSERNGKYGYNIYVENGLNNEKVLFSAFSSQFDVSDKTINIIGVDENNNKVIVSGDTSYSKLCIFSNSIVTISNVIISENSTTQLKSWFFGIKHNNTIIFENCIFRNIGTTNRQFLINNSFGGKNNKIIVKNCVFESTVGTRFSILSKVSSYNGHVIIQYDNTFEGSTSESNIGNDCTKGLTSEAPNSGMQIGDTYYSTDSSKPLYWNGTAWVDATGATV